MTRIWLLVFGVLAMARVGLADVPTTAPSSAVTYRHEVWAKPPMHLHIVTVNLSDPAVRVKVAHGGVDPNLTAPWETTLMPVSEMCERDGLFLAVNGNFFMPKSRVWVMGRWVPYFPGNWARVSGWAMCDGRLYSERPLDVDRPTLVVNDKGKITIGRFDRIPEGAGQAVAGNAQVVTDGKNTAPMDWDQALAPRTGAGIDRDGTKLILLVVDGRRPAYSAGMSERELGDEMIRLGAWEAINLDGAGSSTLVMRDAQGRATVMNRPSDGHDLVVDISVPRSVADALGVVIDPAAMPSSATTRP